MQIIKKYQQNNKYNGYIDPRAVHGGVIFDKKGELVVTIPIHSQSTLLRIVYGLQWTTPGAYNTEIVLISAQNNNPVKNAMSGDNFDMPRSQNLARDNPFSEKKK